MSATKKVASKTAKSASKKSAASAPAKKTFTTKINKSAKTGKIVSDAVEKRQPNTTYKQTVERPLSGAAAKAATKKVAVKKASVKTAAKKAPAKKVAQKGKGAGILKNLGADLPKVTKKTTAKSTKINDLSKTLKKASRKLASPNTEASEIAEVTRPIAEAIVKAVHVAAEKEVSATSGIARDRGTHSKTARAADSKATVRPVSVNASAVRPHLPTHLKARTEARSDDNAGPFRVDAVREALDQTAREDVHNALRRSMERLF